MGYVSSSAIQKTSILPPLSLLNRRIVWKRTMLSDAIVSLDSMKMVEKYLKVHFGIGNQNLSSLSPLFAKKQYVKNDYLTKIGKYSFGLAIIHQGYVRMHALNPDGHKEITHWIAGPGEFVTDLATLIFDAPSRWDIQALTNLEAYVISKEDYRNIQKYLPEWPLLEKLFLSKCFISVENRVFDQLSLTAEEKYLRLMDLNPDLLNQVPLQYLASMLGMTPETFSRVRRKLSDKTYSS